VAILFVTQVRRLGTVTLKGLPPLNQSKSTEKASHPITELEYHTARVTRCNIARDVVQVKLGLLNIASNIAHDNVDTQSNLIAGNVASPVAAP
jgi:hypothetical protein